jgi:hypothetical protein
MQVQAVMVEAVVVQAVYLVVAQAVAQLVQVKDLTAVQ